MKSYNYKEFPSKYWVVLAEDVSVHFGITGLNGAILKNQVNLFLVHFFIPFLILLEKQKGKTGRGSML